MSKQQPLTDIVLNNLWVCVFAQETLVASDNDGGAAPFHNGSLLGPAQFSHVSPEREAATPAAKGGSLTKEEDVWALGCTGLGLALGIQRMSAPLPVLVKAATPDGADGPTPSQLNCVARSILGRDLDADVCCFICSCLWRDPGKRPTAQELLESPLVRRAHSGPAGKGRGGGAAAAGGGSGGGGGGGGRDDLVDAAACENGADSAYTGCFMDAAVAAMAELQAGCCARAASTPDMD
jgi:hypothetical protein